MKKEKNKPQTNKQTRKLFPCFLQVTYLEKCKIEQSVMRTLLSFPFILCPIVYYPHKLTKTCQIQCMPIHHSANL